MDKNQHGLSRHIPSEVKRTVRQNSKFGCVICRSAICQYEHIIPSFADAQSHDPENMCLLCGTCHDKVTRGMLSKVTVSEARKHVLSRNVKRPFENFDLTSNNVRIKFGSNIFDSPKSLILFEDRKQVLGRL